MGVCCQILINRPKGGHKAGKPVTGIVRYSVDKPAQYKYITLSLIGKGKCHWTERRNKKSYSYTGRELYTTQRLNLHKDGPEDILLPIGTYEQPFNFVLPSNIPSSFKDSTCTITYKIVLKFEKPSFFSVCKKFDSEIDVIGIVRPLTPEGVAVTELEKTLFTPFKKRKHHVQMQTKIPNTIFRPGQHIEVNCKVTNDTDIIIPSVKAELKCHTTYTANCGRRKKTYVTIGECTVETPSVPDNAIANLISTLPLKSFVYTIQNSKVILNEYRLKVTLRLPMPYMNASTKIPIVIGEKHEENDVEMFVPESEEFEEEPPSYFEVMNESKEKKEND